MVMGVLNINGFVRHIQLDEHVLQRGRVVIPMLPAMASMLEPRCSPEEALFYEVEFVMSDYDEENHIAYFEYNRMW